MVVGARQSFQFFGQKAWFLENNRALSKFLYGVSHEMKYQIKRMSKIDRKKFKMSIQRVRK